MNGGVRWWALAAVLCLAACAGGPRAASPVAGWTGGDTQAPLRAPPGGPEAEREPVRDATPAAPVPAAASDSGRTTLGRGLASWYGRSFQGRRTASGERYDRRAFTAAHRTLPFGTRVRVRSVVTGQEVLVRINDRGPFKATRIIDLSEAAMVALGVRHHGVSEVELWPE